MQMTTHSFLKRFEQHAKAATTLLVERNMAHFIASDAHDTEHHPPVMDGTYRYIEREYGKRCAEALFAANPRTTLAGEPVQAVKPDVAMRAARWWPL